MPTDTATHAFKLDEFVPYLVNVLGSRLSNELGAEYGERFGISISEWRVMAHLSQHERVSVREIYRRVEMDKVKVSRAAARLEASGLITKEPSEDDRRLVCLSLTPKGHKVFSEVAELALSFEQRYLDKLSPDEAREFRRLLTIMLG
ncbi:MarR family winged helix-turn-helix transcriptional regulator [Amorphus orientalis]|uniref:DNA-binding MarR family transcriptional regulator n=1 Tax=Amorphus orientalis TaxID=649198 RepID=A0AAE4ATA2_9HYPH|nr:MarR family transcriptional regulator [Amorphus orientalis]MDQ0315957.1 DNA-binding MarR family transcriptional regulator [Amorphus orientalis]